MRCTPQGEHYQKRDRLGFIVEYRRKFLDSLVGTTDFTDDTDKAGEGTTSRIIRWVNTPRTRHSAERFPSVVSVKSVVNLLFSGPQADRRHQPGEGRGRHPDVAGDRGRPARLHPASGLGLPREITPPIFLPITASEISHGASLDFSDEAELAQLRRLHETLQLEIIAVLESLNRLRESPDYELCQLSERKPGVLDELAAERKQLLEQESVELQQQADKLAEEIRELSGQAITGIN